MSAYSIVPAGATMYRAGIINSSSDRFESREIDPRAFLDGAHSSSQAFQPSEACETSDHNGTGTYARAHDRLQRRGLAYAVAIDDADRPPVG
jgi:hypothetical protein